MIRKDPARQHQTIHSLPVESAVKQALYRSGYDDLRSLDVICVDGQVRIVGRVRSYFLKQKVQMIAMSVAQGRELQNEVVVQ
jgi:osmotically-inducible protein OsmY